MFKTVVREMGKWCILVVVVVALAVVASARNVPAGDAGVKDEKNLLNYGGPGGFSGVGDNGLPLGGVGVGAGAGVGAGIGVGGGTGGGLGGIAGLGLLGGGGLGGLGGTSGGVDVPHDP